MIPRREVVETPAGFRVTKSSFVTSDLDLAVAVAAEYDRVDPLPCTHAEYVASQPDRWGWVVEQCVDCDAVVGRYLTAPCRHEDTYEVRGLADRGREFCADCGAVVRLGVAS